MHISTICSFRFSLLLAGSLLASPFMSGLVNDSLVAQETVDLTIDFVTQKITSVDAQVEHDGSVSLVPSDPEQPLTALPLKVDARFKYFQRPLGENQMVRFFESAHAKIRLQKGQTEPELAPENRWIIARLKPDNGSRVEIASIKETLTQAEYDLLQRPADSLSLAEFFAREKVQEGETWSPTDDALSRFLQVDTIIDNQVQLGLKKLTKKQAQITISGQVSAVVNDVTTEIVLNGLATIDHTANAIESLRLSLKQKRGPGQIDPGFEGQTRVVLKFDGDQDCDQLSHAALSRSISQGKIRQRVKYISPTVGFRLDYDPRWKLIDSKKDLAVLRLIDHGDLLAQCDVMVLPSRPASQPLTLDKFHSELGHAIESDDTIKLVHKNQSVTKGGLTQLQVVISGEEEGVPMNWFYYHLSNAEGRQATLVFTLEASLATRVRAAAAQLLAEFQFTEPSQAVAGQPREPGKSSSR